MTVKIALAGNPNCGKTTVFNNLTGSNQYVGNWPGVTVEKKEGLLKGRSDVVIMDLPGIYSLSPYTAEEVIAREYLVMERPDAILNIIDGTNIERNLYLTTQLLELGIPLILAVNMADVLKKQGQILSLKRLSNELGVTVTEISAVKNWGLDEAAEKAVRLAKHGPRPMPLRFNGRLENSLFEITAALDKTVPNEQKRFFAIKLFERDSRIDELIDLAPIHNISKAIADAEKIFDDDSESIIINERYTVISSIIKKCCIHKPAPAENASYKIDKILTNRFLAFPIFALIMFAVYFISVTTIGTYLSDFVNNSIFGSGFWILNTFVSGIPDIVQNLLLSINAGEWLISLIIDGIIAGVGSVLGFVPQIMVLFFLLSFLEGCGYMARVAFIMDRVFKKFGLSGKSFIPIMIGTGCGVPGIMSSRTIENSSDRRMTVITTTFIPCGAKLPMIAMLSGVAAGNAYWAAPSAYLIGLCAIMVSGLILKKTKIFSDNNTPFIMELPPYHMPTFKNVMRNTWDRAEAFIKKAGSVILLSAIVIWLLSNLGFTNSGFGFVNSYSDGILAFLGKAVSYIFIPLGFGSWEAAVAVLTGLVAKENIVSTLAVLLNFNAPEAAYAANALDGYFTPLMAYSFMVFNLLCMPCFAAMAAISREMNSNKWTLFAFFYQTAFAYIVSMCIYQIGLFLTTAEFGFFTALSFAAVLILIYLLFRKNTASHQSSTTDSL